MTFTNLFSQNTDVSVNFLTWNRRFKSNSFDVYSQEGNNIEIQHSAKLDCDVWKDVFSVQAMIYEYKGCWVGNQIHFGQFNTFEDAVACAECAQLPEDSITKTEAYALM